MEFVEGETLENLVKRSGKLEVTGAGNRDAGVPDLAAVHKQKLVTGTSNQATLCGFGGGKAL